MAMRQLIFLKLLFTLFVIVASSSAQPPSAASPSKPDAQSAFAKRPVLDGRWWARISLAERVGYINGYEDCYVYDAKGPHSATGWTANHYVEAVEAYYHGHKNDRTASVTTVLEQVNRTGEPRPVPKGGEEWKEPHGYYDGLWWRGSSASEQLGYIEGYLSCYASEIASPPATFSKSAHEYVALMNAYVKGHAKSDDEKVAYILHRFRDSPSGR